MTINLGSIVNLNGRSVGSGISSGLDTEAIINALTEARRAPAARLEDTIELNQSRITAFSSLKTIVEGLRSAADFLRAPPGFNNASDNIFMYRTSSLSSSLSSISNYLGVTASAGAGIGDYDIEIGQVALNRQQRTGSFSSQSSDIVDDATGAITSLDFGENEPVVDDTITIGGATYTFVENGTDSDGTSIELGTTLTETLANIKSHLSSTNGQAVHADVDNFTYSVSGTSIIATSKTVGGADDAIDFSASIAAGAPTVGDTAGSYGNSAGMFSAGIFQFASTLAVDVASTTDTSINLTSSDYTVNGAVGSSVLSTGISNITVDGDEPNGYKGLLRTITGISGSYDVDADTLTLSVSINGRTFTSNEISTAAGAGSDSIAAGQTITFTDGDETSATSFDVVVGAEYLIDDTVENADAFVTSLEADLASQTILQDRALSNVNTDNIPPASPLYGLTSSDVIYRTGDYSSIGLAGDISGFTVTRNGSNDTDISVTINDEVFTVTGLSDTLNGNITLTGSNGEQLSLNLGDAGVSFDIADDAAATELQNALDFAFGTKSLTHIEIENDFTLVDIAAAINAQSSASGVSASIVQVSDTDFRLTLQATDVGLDNSYEIVDYNQVWHAGTGDGSDGVEMIAVQSAQDSFISVNGIVVQRSSNSIDDVIDNITFSIHEVTGSAFTSQSTYDALGSHTEIVATIANDTETVESAVVNFINAYNEFRVFAATQTFRDAQGNLGEDAVLGDNTTLSTLINQISGEVSSAISGVSDSDFATLGAIGITLTDYDGDDENPEVSNILTYDPDKLSAALANNYDEVREIFEMSFSASSSNLALYESNNSATLTDYQIDIDTSRESGDEVRILDSDGDFLFNATLSSLGGSYYISGDSGTTLSGLGFIYTGDGDDVITVGSSYGIADRLYNIMDDYAEDDGVIDTTVADIVDENEDLEVEVTDIDYAVDQYRLQLIDQYTALESAITQVNTLLQFIESQANLAASGN